MPEFIRCTDESTGHEVDVDKVSIRPGLVPIPDYKPNKGPGARPRPPKHRVTKDGQRAAPRRTPATQPKSDDTSEGDQV